MSNVIGPTAAEFIIWLFDIRSALVSRLHTDDLANISAAVDLIALADLVLTAAWHDVGKFHVVVDGVVHGFDSVGIVDGKLRVTRYLDGFIDDTIPNTKRVEDERDAFFGPCFDGFIMLEEVFVKGWAVVPPVRLSPQVKEL